MGNILHFSNLRKTYYYMKKNGLKAAVTAAAERCQSLRSDNYVYCQPAEEKLKEQRERKWEYMPLISVAVPAYETKESYLNELLDSLEAQTYPNWELLIADASQTQQVASVVQKRKDARIRYFKLENNKGISENTNAAIEKAEGEYVGLLDHDDLLTPDALYCVADALEEGKRTGRELLFLYSDEDKCDGDGKTYYEPHKKMDFNADLLLSNNYICHFLVIETNLMRKLMLRADYDGAQDFDLVLRAAEAIGAFEQKRAEELPVYHMDTILYHWRCHRDSTAANPASKRYAYEAGKRALEDFCRRNRIEAEIGHTRHLGFYRIEYKTSVLEARKDIGAVAAPFHGESGIYEADGSQRFEGLKKGFSGYMHRAVLQQDADCADVRAMHVCPKLQPEWQAAVRELEETGGKREDAVRISRAFCRKIREEGYKIYWDPEAGVKHS